VDSEYGSAVAIAGWLVFLADSFSGVRAIDVSDPLQPVEVGAWRDDGWAVDDVQLYGSVALLSAGDSVNDRLRPQ
jgi:hypothetical protein